MARATFPSQNSVFRYFRYGSGVDGRDAETHGCKWCAVKLLAEEETQNPKKGSLQSFPNLQTGLSQPRGGFMNFESGVTVGPQRSTRMAG